jgi:hypothetical protein
VALTQSRGLQFEADHEQQQHDAKFREVQRALDIGVHKPQGPMTSPL